MVIAKSVKWLPGQEPEEVKGKLQLLFTSIDLAFPQGIIVWENWNHLAWDSMAVSLCRELGYSRGADFLSAYGYSILFEGKLVEPAPPVKEQEEAAAEKAEAAPEVKPVQKAEAVSAIAAEVSAAEAVSAAAEEAPAVEDVSEDVVLSGKIIKVLSYSNSGFVRQDDGKDYYFNVRDFTHRVRLHEGLRVNFRLVKRMDHKRGKMRLSAVDLTAV